MVIYVFCAMMFCLILAVGLRLKWILTAVLPNSGSEERSLSFYAPMERLLSESDFRFLKGRTEIPNATIRRLRSDRRKLFRKYLGYLSVDFTGIVTELRAMMLDSDVSRPDLVRSLIWMQVVFAFAVLAIEARLALHACGIHTVSISAARLTEGLASMRLELRHMQSVPVLSAV